MAKITIDNYTSYFDRPATPTINLDMSTVGADQFYTAKSNYSLSTSSYSVEYQTYFDLRNYIEDKLKKDALTSVGLAKIDYHNNTYTANVKADNYWDVANNGYNLTTSSGIENQYSNLTRLSEQLFLLTPEDIAELNAGSDLTSSTNASLEEDGWYAISGSSFTSSTVTAAFNTVNNLYLDSVQYDAKAKSITLPAIELSDNTSTEAITTAIFINAIPNAQGTDVVLCYYDTNNTLKYTIKNMSINDVNEWVLLDNSLATQEDQNELGLIIAKVTITGNILDANTTFNFTAYTYVAPTQ